MRDRLLSRDLLTRLPLLMVGLVVFGTGVALMVAAGAGLGPWEAFHQGISRLTGIPLGTVSILLGLPILALWIPIGQRPGIGTFLNVLLIGSSTNVALSLLPHPTELPLQVAQMALGVIDLCAAASALYLLLPAGHVTEFVHFLAAYVFGCLLGIVAHTPGGIGPFEMTMLKAVTTPTQEGLLASLLIFRIVYYFIPFVLALALIGAHEGMRRWNALREAMRRAQDDEGGRRG